MQTKQDIPKQRKEILPKHGGGGDATKTFQQSDARETEQFWSKIWQPREHNKKVEWKSNMEKDLEGLEEGPKVEIHVDILKTTLKNIKLENARPRWIHESHLHSRQTSTRNEQMPTRSTRTRIDEERTHRSRWTPS